jgi:hypothetical protein
MIDSPASPDARSADRRRAVRPKTTRARVRLGAPRRYAFLISASRVFTRLLRHLCLDSSSVGVARGDALHGGTMSISRGVPDVVNAAGPRSSRAPYRRFSEVRSDGSISNGQCVLNVSGSGPIANHDISSQVTVVGIYRRRRPIYILFMNVAPTVATGGCPSKNLAELPRCSTAIGSGPVARPMAVGLSAG